MNIAVLCEGSIDLELLSALIGRIARTRAGIMWPVRVLDAVEVRYRKGGHGQIVRALKHLRDCMNEEPWSDCGVFVVVIDERSGPARARIRRLIRGNGKFVFGIAIREIEAWWLADRKNTLEWLRLSEDSIGGLRYATIGYRSERDDAPKRTLNELTGQSDKLETTYGEGNTELAREFASIWNGNADLDQIELQCHRGFRPFCREAAETLRRESRRMRPRRRQHS
jgi:hypothetical protein